MCSVPEGSPREGRGGEAGGPQETQASALRGVRLAEVWARLLLHEGVFCGKTV